MKLFFKCLIPFLILRNIPRLFLKPIKISKNVLLVIAHPDDDAMFFTPFISAYKPHTLCISECDKYRRMEMETFCAYKNINCKIISDNFEDGDVWDENDIARSVANELCDIINGLREPYEKLTVVTFDSYGVSGHGIILIAI